MVEVAYDLYKVVDGLLIVEFQLEEVEMSLFFFSDWDS